jgi:intracellular multiplication protein IcmP
MAQQQQQPSGDNSLAAVWICVFILLVGYGIWTAFHTAIVTGLFAIDIVLAKMILYFVSDAQLINDISLMQNSDPSLVQISQLGFLLTNVGDYVRYPIIIIFILLAVLLYRSDITMKFHKIYSMKTLRSQEQHHWTAIMPVVKEDLVNTDINVGPWAMALTPMEFARKHNLLKKNDVLLDGNIPGLELTASIRRSEAKRVFTLQLGPVWAGFDKCAPYVQALSAIFIARINRDQKAAKLISSTIDHSFAHHKKVDYSIAQATLNKYKDTPLVKDVVARHAYLLTVMSSLLEAARDDGVVPASEFIWLKTVDRRLWYVLNCVGRQTSYSEVGGPFAHWKAERLMNRPSLAPMIDEAVKALDVAIKEILLSPQELQELTP